MPERRLDLHMHSDRSDGRYPAEEVLRRASLGGLDVIALADHDLPAVLAAGDHVVEGRTVRVLAAAEVSGNHDGREFHLLVYFPGKMPEDFSAFLRHRAALRAKRYDDAISILGVPLPPSDAEAQSGARSLTRHHLFRALMATGTVTEQEAWRKLGGSTVVPLIDLTFLDAIRTARAAGAYTSWAHPSLADAQRHVATFAAAGLQALEGIRPTLDRSARNGLKKLAKKHHLALTGGSDWHGWWQGELGQFAFTGEFADSFSAQLGL